MRTAFKVAAIIFFAILALVAPSYVSTFTLNILTTALIFSIFALSLDLILGHAGLPSLGHAVFFGIGGYTVGLLTKHGFNDFLTLVLAGIIASASAAALIGPVVLRTRKIYFLMVTLAIGEVMRNIAISWRSVTGGDDGLSGVNAGSVAGIDFADAHNLYFLALFSLLAVISCIAILTRAPFGHALHALRDNRDRISVLGINPIALELTAFIISAGIAGFAGVLFVYEKAFVYPNVFSVEVSARALLMVVLGGAGTLLGPVVGAFLVEFIRGIGSVYTDRWQTVLGLLAVFVAINSRQLLLGGLPALFQLDYWFGKAAREQMSVQPVTALNNRTARQAVPATPISRKPFVEPARLNGQNGALVTTDRIVKNFGGLSVLNGISLSVEPGERRGLIGPNGAGKTTFLNILSSTLPPTTGRVIFAGEDITALPPSRRAQLGIGRTFQIANLFNDCSVRENVALALVAREGYGFRFGRALSQYTDLQHEVVDLLEKWKLNDIQDVNVKFLSYGERRIVEIVLAVATQPQLLLLDEPAAGLSGAETKVIIDTISALDPQLSILVVDHDMDLIFSICDRVTVLANGEILAEGAGDDIRRNESVISAYLGMPL